MAEMSLRFNFDDFDQQIAEALEQNEVAMSKVVRRPGEIGGVALQLTSLLPEQPAQPSQHGWNAQGEYE